jgi:hypothetical protein
LKVQEPSCPIGGCGPIFEEKNYNSPTIQRLYIYIENKLFLNRSLCLENKTKSGNNEERRKLEDSRNILFMLRMNNRDLELFFCLG